MSIVQFPHSVLKTPVRKVTDFGPSLERLVETMRLAMEQACGVGIAANQVGVAQAVFLAKSRDKILTFVNPEITYQKGQVLSTEGCLSLIGKVFKVRRFTSVQLTFQDVYGDRHELSVHDKMLASIIGHEMDHLNGICLADYCKHTDCSCNYSKHRAGELDLSYAFNKPDLDKKLGTGNLIGRKG